MQLLQILSVLGMSAYLCTALDFDDVTKATKDEMRIYGGDDADASKVPYIASVRKSAEGETYCGGALIASQYVLTAAHCVKNTTMYVSLGSRYRKGDKEGERIEIKESYVHPQYDASKHLYDVAILKLDKPSTIKPVSLCNADGSDSKENTMAVVRGWGVTENGKAPDELKELNVRIQSNAQCNKLFNNRITDSMLCAGEGGGKDTCQGDSGGPLVNKNVLIGVVSWGGTCGEKAGVYTRVTSILDFINEKIGAKTPTATTVKPAPAPAPTAATPTASVPSTKAPEPKPEPVAPSTKAPEPKPEPVAPSTQAPEPTTATPSVTTTPSTPSTESPAKQEEIATPAPVPPPVPAPVPAPVPPPVPAPVPAPEPLTPKQNCGVKD